MTTAPAAAGQPGRDDLTARIFRALYQEFDLRTINGTYVVVPKGTPWVGELAAIPVYAHGDSYRTDPPDAIECRDGAGRGWLLDAH